MCRGGQTALHRLVKVHESQGGGGVCQGGFHPQDVLGSRSPRKLEAGRPGSQAEARRRERAADHERLEAPGRREIGKLMSMAKHELLVSHLLAEYQRDPPPGFNKLTMGQVSAADTEVRVRLAELTRGGLTIGPQGELPLDVHSEAVLRSPSCGSSCLSRRVMPRRP